MYIYTVYLYIIIIIFTYDSKHQRSCSTSGKKLFTVYGKCPKEYSNNIKVSIIK